MLHKVSRITFQIYFLFIYLTQYIKLDCMYTTRWQRKIVNEANRKLCTNCQVRQTVNVWLQFGRSQHNWLIDAKNRRSCFTSTWDMGWSFLFDLLIKVTRTFVCRYFVVVQFGQLLWSEGKLLIHAYNPYILNFNILSSNTVFFICMQFAFMVVTV